jgi:hypothetical protein
VFVAQPRIEDSRTKFIDGFSHGEHAVMQQEPPKWPSTWTCDDRLGVKLQPLSFNHGLDLNASKGHYAFARQIQLGGQVRHLVFLVLDTEDLPPNTGGAGGVMGQGQIDWVRDVLKCVQANDLVLVFSHHSLGELQTAKSGTCPVDLDGKVTQVSCNELESLFANNKHVVGHFYGHKHTHGLCRNGRPTTCTQFWEIETGAMIEFPQEARLVHLEYLGSGLAYFDLTTFGERLEGVENELTRAVARGRRGAERDFCHTHTEIKCSPDLHVQRQDGRHTNARLFFRLPETR